MISGLELGSDRRTCIEPEAFLVYSVKNIIGRVSVVNENNNAVLPLKEIKEVRFVSKYLLFRVKSNNNIFVGHIIVLE